MTLQDDYPLTDTDKLVGRVGAELSRLSLQDRIDAVLCACSTTEEIKAMVVSMIDYARGNRQHSYDIIPRIVSTQRILHGREPA